MKAAHTAICNAGIAARIVSDDESDKVIVTITPPAPRPEPWYIRAACTFPLLDLLTLALLAYLLVSETTTLWIGQIDAWLMGADRASVDRFMNRCGAAIMLLFVGYITWACFTAYYSGAFDRLVR